MTRRIPPQDLKATATLATPVSLQAAEYARAVFQGAPRWQMESAIAALCRFRPDLGSVDVEAHMRHMLTWPRNADYFLRVCRLLKHYGVGSQWGPD